MSLLSTSFFLSFIVFIQSCLSQNTTSVVYQGFNSGNTLPDYTAKNESDFITEFTTMQNLINSPGLFNSVRLYTNIQAYTTSDPLSAIPAAIKTNTSILLGIWCSGADNITAELTALSTALDTWGAEFANSVIAISVGSEDLYRLSDIGIAQDAGIGAGPDAIVGFINDTRNAIVGTILKDKPVGHVDTWRSWVNDSNSAVVEAADWIGVDIYPFFENNTDVAPLFLENTPENYVTIFEDRYNQTLNASQGKPVWVTETGHPFKSEGPAWGASVASVEDQRNYWQGVGCSELFGRVSTWWYTLRDANPTSLQKFAITDEGLSTGGSFDLSCPAGSGAPVTVNAQDTSAAVSYGVRSGVLKALTLCFFAAMFIV